ncbi:MAG: hypothetical protein WAU04_12020 [Candidatus Nitrotoga sp.]
MLVAPAAAVTAPVQFLTTFGVGATNTFPGKASTKAALSVIGVALMFSSVMISLETSPEAIETGLNALLMPGGLSMVSVALAEPGLVRP